MSSRRNPRPRNVAMSECQQLRKQVAQLRAEVRRDEHGRKYTPTRSPRSIAELPWNPIVLTDFQTSSSTVTTGTILNPYAVYISLIAQLGLQTAAPPVEFRFQRVEAWNMGAASGDTDAALILEAYALQGVYDTPYPIARLEDQPAKNQWAACGYEWPASHKNYVWQIPGKEPTYNPAIIRFYSDVASSRVWLRFHLLWRFTVAQPPLFGEFVVV